MPETAGVVRLRMVLRNLDIQEMTGWSRAFIDSQRCFERGLLQTLGV